MPTPRCAGRPLICTASRCPSRCGTSPNSSRERAAGGAFETRCRPADGQDHIPRSLPAGAQGRRQRCAARAHDGRMGVELHEMKNHGGFSFCCGGGGGVLDIERAAPLRYRTMENKLREIDDTGRRDLHHELLGLPAHLRRRSQAISAGTRRRTACWSWWLHNLPAPEDRHMSAQTIVVDPVTRIEGHLRIEAEYDGYGDHPGIELRHHGARHRDHSAGPRSARCLGVRAAHLRRLHAGPRHRFGARGRGRAENTPSPPMRS